jgi:TadE-like protein
VCWPPRPCVAKSRSGQSLVEFGLILPIMLLLLVAFADFGRIFANSILLEAAARNGAELAANDYLAGPPGGTSLGAAPTGDATYYANLHLLAARAVCVETQELPNSNYDSGTTNCPGMPLIRVCVHDDADPVCDGDVFGASIPVECGELASAMTNSRGGSSERWVEVRACYQFTSLVDVPLVSFGTFWLERTRTFAIPCYFVMVNEPCG